MDFDTQSAFPPDDTGYGFDTIGDTLTLPPMLLEKYLNAAEKMVGRAVPVEAKTMPGETVWGTEFHGPGDDEWNGGAMALSYYAPASVSNTATVHWPGQYNWRLDLSAHEHFVDNVFDYNKCRVIFRVDGRELWRREFNRESDSAFHFDFEQKWQAGPHVLAIQLQPLDAE